MAAKPPVAQRGFTLLEVLIAVVVLAIGLLGVASLQLAGLKSTGDSYARSQASFFIYAISDSMRANAAATRAGRYDVTMAATAAGAIVDCVGADKNCSPTELAAFEITTWKRNLRALMSGGNGSIVSVVDPVTGVATATVTLAWTSIQGTGAVQSLTVAVEI